MVQGHKLTNNDRETNFFDSILMLILNESAFAAGLIDKSTKDKITKEICVGERSKAS